MKLAFLICVGSLFLLCAGTSKTISPSFAPDSSTPPPPAQPESQKTPTAHILPVADNYSPPLSPPQWVGKKFIILPKQELVCAQGYALFTCLENECDTAPVDPMWEHANHRVRCDKIRGDSLFVETVNPDQDEWIITFFHIPTEKRLYARTHKNALQELAFSDDLTAARRRWMNTFVFSKKGVISVSGNTASTTINSLRITIQDSLRVVDVKWGMTPLPVKPIWLIVKKMDGKQGFIPVRYSWTNTMTDRQTDRLPWEEDLYETCPATLFNWDDNTWELINNHRVVIEMTPDQVTASWGYPSSTATSTSDPLSETIWTYPSHELRFTSGKLTAITERPQSSE